MRRTRSSRVRSSRWRQYAEIPNAQAENRTKFDAVLQTLKQNAWTNGDGTVDIKAELDKEKGIKLSEQAVLRQVPATGPAIAWSIVDGKQLFKILLQHPLTSDGYAAHTITVTTTTRTITSENGTTTCASRTWVAIRIRLARSWLRISIASQSTIW